MSYKSKRVWIIGASSGIGSALATHLAAQGASLILSARNATSLLALHSSLPGGPHQVLPLDVTDHAATLKAADLAAKDILDSVIFLAAVYEPMELDALRIPDVKQMLDVNLMGAFHVVDAMMPVLKRQTTGQLALCGSVAGYIGLPHAQPYSATKAAIRNLAESLYAETRAFPNIDIRLISPGFVRTPMTDKNRFPMPCILEPDTAARKLADGLSRPGFEVHFPKRFTWTMKILAFLPYPLYFWLVKNLT